MNFLYISPEFPPNYKHFTIELNRAGVNVFGLGESDFYSLPEDLRSSLKWYVQCPLGDLEAVDQALDYLVGEVMLPQGYGKFDLVESHNEYWMRVEAFANQKLDLPGICPPDLDKLQKKAAMKEVFNRVGLKTARGGLVKNLEQALALAREVGYPLIFKPNLGVGAFGICKVENQAQLRRAWPQLRGEYVLEEFLDSPMVTYDGLVDKNGTVIFENSLVYGCGVLESVLGADTFFYTLRKIPPPLSRIGKQLVEAFGIKRKYFHFEFFARNGDYLPVEINARPPGGPILDMMNYSVDGDLYRGYAAMLTSGELALKSRKKYFCGYAGRKDKSYSHAHEEILDLYGSYITEAEENPGLFWQGMGIYRYIFRSGQETEILKMKDYILGTDEARDSSSDWRQRQSTP